MAKILGLWAVTLAVSGVCFLGWADTVLWYRFGEHPVGTRTVESDVIVNSANPGSLDGYARVCTTSANSQPSTALTPVDRMPFYTNGFPSVISVYDPVSGQSLANDTALFCTNKAASSGYPGSVVIIDDDEALHLHRQTVEFFMRAPDITGVTTIWQNLLTRDCYHKYSQMTYGLRLTSNRYVTLYVTRGVFDENGVVTNTIEKNVVGNVVVADDRWHHVAVTFDPTTKKASLYMDYALNKTLDYDGVLYYDRSLEPITLGAPLMSNYGQYRGAIDEFRISDEVLTPEQFLRPVIEPSPLVDLNTLVYVDFEGDDDATAFDVFAPALRPGKSMMCANRARYDNGFLCAPFFEYGTNANDVAVTSVADVPGGTGTIRFGLGGRTSAENLRAAHFQTNAASPCVSGRLEIPDANQRIFFTNCTVECFFKVAPGEIAYLGTSRPNTYLISQQGSMQLSTAPGTSMRLQGYDGNSNHQLYFFNAWNATKTIGYDSYNDGLWHHLAIVRNADTKVTDLYVDYVCVATGTNMNHQHANTTYPSKNLCFLGGFWATGLEAYQYRNADLDEVRITRGCLRPHQFLTVYPDRAPLLLAAGFEDDLTVEPYAGFYGNGKAVKFTSAGSVPTFSPRKPGRYIRDGEFGEIIEGDNRRSLQIDGGKVDFGERELLNEAKTFTVEFFVNADAAVPGAGLVRNGALAGWSLSFADAAGNLALRIDTTAAAGQSHVFSGSSVADGLWHHVAVVFAPGDEDGLSVRVCRDYVEVGRWEIEGTLSAPVGGGVSLGVSDDPSIGFRGFIDALRVTEGALTAPRFLRAIREGLLLLLR